MPAAPQLTSSSPLPLDGGEVSLPAPPAGTLGHLVLTGELEFTYTGQKLDAARADEPGSLIQIEPGQWHIVESDAATHTYAFQPGSAIQGSPRVRLELNQLVDQHLMSPAQVTESLRGSIRIDAGYLPLAPPPWRPGAAEYAGLGLALFMLGLYVARAIQARRLQSADLRRELARIRVTGRTLVAALKKSTEIDAKAWARIPALLATAEHLAVTARKLRRKLERAGAARLQQELEALHASAAEGSPNELLAEKQRTLALLEPLIIEERTLTARLERIRATLESLETTWVTEATPASKQTVEEAGELLDRVSREVGAAIETRREMGGY